MTNALRTRWDEPTRASIEDSCAAARGLMQELGLTPDTVSRVLTYRRCDCCGAWYDPAVGMRGRAHLRAVAG